MYITHEVNIFVCLPLVLSLCYYWFLIIVCIGFELVYRTYSIQVTFQCTDSLLGFKYSYSHQISNGMLINRVNRPNNIQYSKIRIPQCSVNFDHQKCEKLVIDDWPPKNNYIQ